MLAAVLSVCLSWNVTTNAVATNFVRRVRMRAAAEPTPVESFWRFARGRTVKFPSDERPKDYRKEEPDRRKRPPRKAGKK